MYEALIGYQSKKVIDYLALERNREVQVQGLDLGLNQKNIYTVENREPHLVRKLQRGRTSKPFHKI